MASLRDVAERAGVSVATASRVASGSAAVRDRTRERVESAMRELLYVPPSRADRSSAIGLFVPEFGNPVFAALAEAMETHAARAGLATILCNTHGSAKRELDYVRMLLERRVEGMLFISAEITDVRGKHSHYAQLLERGARLVFVNGGSADLEVTSVGVDERAAGRIATEHLIELGHERIGFVAGRPYALPTREKSLGRLDALNAAALEDGSVAYADFGVGGGREALRELLSAAHAERPTGVICSSDLMAIGAMQEAAARGIRVPADLSIVGFDGIDAAGWTDPPLTTVEQPIDEIARTAVAALRAQVERPAEHQPSYVFRPRLRVGGTSAPPPAAPGRAPRSR
jgi:DNA-binding LacI/PurR family transcriptional regulator